MIASIGIYQKNLADRLLYCSLTLANQLNTFGDHETAGGSILRTS